MSVERRARITWSPEQLNAGLPDSHESIDPAWFAPGEEGWSLVCQYAISPPQQGSPSIARVHFWIAEAPHERLVPGALLRMFERGTTKEATVEILE
jgi:hypothetical protein